MPITVRQFITQLRAHRGPVFGWVNGNDDQFDLQIVKSALIEKFSQFDQDMPSPLILLDDTLAQPDNSWQ